MVESTQPAQKVSLEHLAEFKLLEKELTSYRQLQGQKAKYLEAERMMGKAFLLLMANLGLNTKSSSRKWLEKSQSLEGQAEREQQLKQTCAESSGPEVVINPYAQEKECPPCKQCPEPVTSRRASQLRKKWLKNPLSIFRNPYLKKMNPSRIFDFDIHSELFEGGVYQGALNKVYASHLKGFLGEWKGEYYSNGKLNAVSFIVAMSSEEKGLALNLQMQEWDGNAELIQFHSTLTAYHPVSHNHTKGGTCRGLVLESDKLRIHLIRIYKGQNQTQKEYLYARLFRSEALADGALAWVEKADLAVSRKVLGESNNQGNY